MVKTVEFRKLREHIEHIPKKRDMVLIKTLYLTATRVSEIITNINPCDLKNGMTKPYGRHFTWKIEDFRINHRKAEKALAITLAIAKRRLKTKEQKEQGFIPKVVALPVMPHFEPFTEELLKWITTHDTLSFPLTRSRVYKIVCMNLRELDRNVKIHSLRHWRITHLVDKYQFSPPDLTAYAGWTVTSAFGAVGIAPNPMMNIYYHSAWQSYFPKLLKPIKDLL